MPRTSSRSATSPQSDLGMAMSVWRRSLNCTAGTAPYLNLRTEPQTKKCWARVINRSKVNLRPSTVVHLGHIDESIAPRRSASSRSPSLVKQLEQATRPSDFNAFSSRSGLGVRSHSGRRLSGGVLGVFRSASVTEPPHTKLLPIESILQYCFAIPKPLKACPGPGGCRIAPLCKPSTAIPLSPRGV